MEDTTQKLPAYYSYWGKAASQSESAPHVHLLPYHSLDVAAVAEQWWSRSPVIRRLLCSATGLGEYATRAWVLFFVSLHDIGKLDFRFQFKSIESVQRLQPSFDPDDADPDPTYYHGPGGYAWFVRESGTLGIDEDTLDHWKPWLQAVTGHHGSLPQGTNDTKPDAETAVLNRDAEARQQFIRDMAWLFLTPAGLSLADVPPPTPDLIAGFCSVSDWLGSNEDHFPYLDSQIQLEQYRDRRMQNARSAIAESGLISAPPTQGGMFALYPQYQPRQVQTLIGQIPREPGITLIEAPTGSGKTEAALALAASLLASGTGEAIIFALPTQATANAMYERLQSVANKILSDGGNLLLTHGRAQYHPGFNAMKKGAGRTAQGTEEALAQCVEWLGASRKRAFLGQIGVCTIDQIFLSVLPVRHQFVRAFGIRKAVLIVDEVHAYDAYMYGLLVSVLQGQQKNNGSTILLSATLPSWQKDLLLGNEYRDNGENAPYPLITHCAIGKAPLVIEITDKAQLPPTRSVENQIRATEDLLPDDALVSEIIAAANNGALVTVICNLVADAQSLAARLRESGTPVPVDLFHSRYRFRDRQTRELEVLANYGRDATRDTGRILVATQVVEQSLDLDFDWMVTQICPVDLLFQRMGRLHRHPRDRRPPGYKRPRCTVLVPENDDYGLHECVYEFRRILWRTQKLLEGHNVIRFPEAYREWIEHAYEKEPWPDEPPTISKEAESFLIDQVGKIFTGKRMATVDATPISDTGGAAGRLTRDGEMNLTVVIATKMEGKLHTLEGEPLEGLADWDADEAIDKNSVGVPHTWITYLPKADEEGRHWLIMQRDVTRWISEGHKALFAYAPSNGLSKTDD